MMGRASRVLVAAALFLTLAGAFGLRAEAQSDQPIYPAYEGWVKNPDGTLTLSFAYFSHNAEPVTIPDGPDNWVTPAPADRGFPTTFLPGHHRWQCIMKVGPDFDGDIRWTLSHAGTTTSTSTNMLIYSWEFAAADVRNVMRELDADDIAAAPLGVCINRPPIVRVLGLRGGPGGALPELSVALPEKLQLFGSVRDEGLPSGSTLVAAWRKISGPGTVTFDNPNQARTRASFSVPGTYELELWGSDTERENRFQVSVTVTEAR